jgi:hypothetical protein
LQLLSTQGTLTKVKPHQQFILGILKLGMPMKFSVTPLIALIAGMAFAQQGVIVPSQPCPGSIYPQYPVCVDRALHG